MTHTYRWRKCRRPDLYGLKCRIVSTGTMGSVLVQFETGELAVISRRALRKLP